MNTLQDIQRRIAVAFIWEYDRLGEYKASQLFSLTQWNIPDFLERGIKEGIVQWAQNFYLTMEDLSYLKQETKEKIILEQYQIFVLLPNGVSGEKAIYDTHLILKQMGGTLDEDSILKLAQDFLNNQCQCHPLPNTYQSGGNKNFFYIR
ncbi:hypothetical protein DSM106972_039030 [Dulcicalothrix desertica PCC 7102]|uniref:Uncharacterized protein n=1 Tax=Dulcicalothrix desertica PCC 7102 TaxID=232991 RepID=A0A433VG68_9CYAN|nr:hypothetical protein [Dulcicalothrix desertica]RUT05082.1 hypothetical protein DSM106972_039030 [Dulcicalothrix desertica PCC 7102]TWH43407.1 hypothetical protein CAL7102_07125 [Dulcicalothrix desertica PCC 7102]